MSTPQRLPSVNGDDGVWGDILNQFLTKEHYDTGADNPVNGGHKTITVRAGTASAGTAPIKLTSGTVMTSPEAGAIEFNTDRLYFTQTTSTTRKVVAAFDDSAGALGDIYYRDSGGNFKPLGVGSGSQVLGVASGMPSWRQIIYATATKTGSYSVTSSDVVILANASTSFTITLPTASSSTGAHFYIKKIDSDTAKLVTVQGNGAETIDGSNTAVISVQYLTLEIVCDGTAWFII